KDSTLGRESDLVIEAPVKQEADELNLAPTNSSTATLVIGDAIALTVSRKKGFSKSDFGKFHPGGSLGKELVKDGVIKYRGGAFMKKILVIGSFMTDLVFKTSKMPSKGETYIGEQYEKYTGGKGANQAVAASRLGADVSMIGKLGYDEFGSEHIEKLKEENIGHGGVLFDSTARTGVGNVTIDDAGDNKIIVVPGANLTLNESDIEQHKQLIKDSDIVVLQLEIPIDIVYQCIDLAEEYGKTIILNPAPAQIIDEQIAKKVDY